MCFARIVPLVLIFAAVGCSSSTPPPAPVVEHKPVQPRQKSPEGPTRTDFKTIAQKLVQRCVAGGWINRWRSTAEDVDQAKPRILLRPFLDKTEQNLDPEYLNTELAARMRISGVFDLVQENGNPDFFAQGKLLRLAERNKGGERITVYTATLEMIDPKTDVVAFSCEATVRGEL